MKPKLFDPESVLDTIADVFARGGYEGTSLDDLVARTGLGKQSLYNAFGDKKSMVKKSIECFGKKAPAYAILDDKSKTGRRRIEGFFSEVLKSTQDPKYTGCLVTNLLLEKGATDADVLRAAALRWNSTRSRLQDAVKDGRKDKSIHASVNAELVSYALINFLCGLRVTVLAAANREKIKRVLKMTLESLLPKS